MGTSALRRLGQVGHKVARNALPYAKKLRLLCAMRSEVMAAFARRRHLMTRPPISGKNLVLLLFPANPFLISGGLFSILNIASTSRELLGDSHEIAIAYLPGTAGLAAYPYFPNDEIIFTFAQVMRLFPKPNNLFIHIPECYATKVFQNPAAESTRYIASAQRLHINILNQNILLMPPPDSLMHLKSLTRDLTQTTAHASYCTQDNADKWGTPMLHLSAPIWKEYPYVPYALKNDWIAYSPDANPMASQVLSQLRNRLPHFKYIKINGVSFRRFLEIISHSKYVISFGEGFDGFFFEPYHCGSIGCTARNDIFFSSEMQDWQMIYDSFSDMKTKLADDIIEFEENKEKYIIYSNKKRTGLLSGIDNRWKYFSGQLCRLYHQQYNFLPSTINHKCI